MSKKKDNPENLPEEEKHILKVAANMLEQSRISFDVDDVEVFSTEKSLEVFNEKYEKEIGRKKSIEDITSFFIMYSWIELMGVKNPLAEAMDVWHDDRVILGSVPNLGILTFSHFLSKANNIPYRITSRPGELYERTTQWYRKWYPSLDLKHIRMQRTTTKKINPDFKVREIRKLKIDFHFEDSFEHAEKIVANTNAKVILVPQPWNKNYKPQNNRIISFNGKKYKSKIVESVNALVDTLD